MSRADAKTRSDRTAELAPASVRTSTGLLPDESSKTRTGGQGSLPMVTGSSFGESSAPQNLGNRYYGEHKILYISPSTDVNHSNVLQMIRGNVPYDRISQHGCEFIDHIAMGFQVRA